MEFNRLSQLKIPAQEEQLESAKNRYTALLSSPITESHLGSVDGNLPLRSLIQQNANLYFNLYQGEEILSEETQNVLANMILSEVFHILFTTPRSERTMVIIICDELPVFRSSASMISRFLRRARKLGGRFIGLTQGTQSFPEGTADPLLNAMVSNCNGVFFRHTNPVCAEYFGKVVSLPGRRADRVKFEHEEERQVHLRDEIRTLVNRSITHAYADNEGESGSAGRSAGENQDKSLTVGDNEQEAHTDSQERSKAIGASETDTEGEQTAQGTGERLGEVGQLYGQARHEVAGKNRSKSKAKNTTSTVGDGSSDMVGRGRNRSAGLTAGKNSAWSQESSWNRSRSRTGSATVSFTQQIVPVLVWKKFVRFELMSFDEQDQEKASEIAGFGTGEAFFYAAGEPIVKAYVTLADDYLLRTPKAAAKLLTEMYQDMFAAPFCRLADDVLVERAEVRRLFLEKLREFSHDRLLLPPTLSAITQAYVPVDCQHKF